MIAFLISQRNIRDVLESTRIFSLYVLKNSFSPSLKGGIFLLVFWSFLTQSSRRFCEMMAFLSSQRNIRDVLESTRIFNAKNV